MAANSKVRILNDWISRIDEANNKRKWGQIVEAAEEYTKITRQMRAIISEDKSVFNEQEKQYLDQARRDLHQQAVNLRDFTSSHDMDKIQQIKQTLVQMKQSHDDEDQIHEGGMLATPLHSQCLSIIIEKIGIKKSSNYCQPYIKVYTLTADGQQVGESHETLYSSTFEKDYIIFNSTPIKIKTPLNQLPSGCAIFFELHHYKHSKRKTSMKCFTFMEQDEFKSGPAALEIYKKPTDITRKKLTLLTNKKLYLHLNLSIE